MSVVLRCPSCGTTRATPGECEACHDGTVRFFCTNHTPGVWLDGRTCPQCGGEFGHSKRPTAPRPTARAAPIRPVSSASPAPPRPAATPLPPPVVETRAEPPIEPPPELEPWQQVLAAALRARHVARTSARTRAPVVLRPQFGGCLRRLLLLGLFLFVALAAAAFWFSHTWLQGFSP